MTNRKIPDIRTTVGTECPVTYPSNHIGGTIVRAARSPECEPMNDVGPNRHLQLTVVTTANTDNEELLLLLTRVAQRDQKAFAALYDATSARIYGLVLRTLRSPSHSEETTQEVYLQIWRNASDYDPSRGSALAWLMTLAHRRAIDRVRSEQASRNRDTQYLVASGTPEFDEVAETVAHRMESASVARCLGTLTDKQREAIDLAYYGGLTYPEVARRLGAALPTVKSRIRDGLLRLKSCLGVSA